MTARPRAAETNVAGRTLRLTNLDRVLWPDEGITKGDLIAYYVLVAPLMLPHLAGRPLVFTRYPAGIQGKSFYQKQAPAPRPPWIRTVRVEHEERPIDYVLADEPATLAWLGNLAVVEVHPWMSREGQLDHPDIVVVDLDPDPPASFEDSREVAFWVKRALESLGLAGVPKLSGATGVHVCVPIQPRYTYRQTSRLVAMLGNALSRAFPARVTDARQVAHRHGRVYVDPYQNLRGKTVAGPYSPRPLPGAPVSVPLTWDELEHADPAAFSIGNARAWAPGRIDPLLAAMQHPQSLDAVLAGIPEAEPATPGLRAPGRTALQSGYPPPSAGRASAPPP